LNSTTMVGVVVCNWKHFSTLSSRTTLENFSMLMLE